MRGNLSARFLFLLLMVISLLGCAWGKFGKADGGIFDINKPPGLKGQSKSSIMEILGDPELVLVENATEYWGYRNHNGWYFSAFFANFGLTEAKDLILEFHGEKVKTAYLIHKGSSFGIITPPLAAAN